MKILAFIFAHEHPLAILIAGGLAFVAANRNFGATKKWRELQRYRDSIEIIEHLQTRIAECRLISARYRFFQYKDCGSKSKDATGRDANSFTNAEISELFELFNLLEHFSIGYNDDYLDKSVVDKYFGDTLVDMRSALERRRPIPCL
jgi:hypothetical protein